MGGRKKGARMDPHGHYSPMNSNEYEFGHGWVSANTYTREIKHGDGVSAYWDEYGRLVIVTATNKQEGE